jgi:hypothetical protein
VALRLDVTHRTIADYSVWSVTEFNSGCTSVRKGCAYTLIELQWYALEGTIMDHGGMRRSAEARAAEAVGDDDVQGIVALNQTRTFCF